MRIGTPPGAVPLLERSSLEVVLWQIFVLAKVMVLAVRVRDTQLASGGTLFPGSAEVGVGGGPSRQASGP